MQIRIKRATAFFVFLLTVIMATGSLALAGDPLKLVLNGSTSSATSHYYVGEDEAGFKWDIYFKDYYNDEWRMKKVRESGSVEYYIGNRYIPYSGKRYAASASVYHSSIGDVVAFTSQNWQKEKTFSYNMVRNSDYRFYGCEFWVGADRWDSFYFRNAYIELTSGTFAGKTRSTETKAAQDKGNSSTEDIMGVPANVWRTADKETLRMRLEPEQYEEIVTAREAEDIQ